MKAAVCTRYGPPEVLQIREVKKTTPKNNEILIKVHATTVTAGDTRVRSFTWARWFRLPARFFYGFSKPRRDIPGNELSGVVEAVGKEITRFNVGDEIFGIIWDVRLGGASAEYICMRENEIAIKPSNMSFEEAAAVPIGGITAVVLLRKGKVQTGQKVLVYGASGSVGTYTVQLAKHFGAEVTGVCSTANIDLVKSLGADKVIDYTKEDFTKNGQTYDIIFDAVIKTSFFKCRGSLTPNGRFVTVDWPLLLALWTSLFSRKKVVLGISNKIEDLVFLGELVEAGGIKAIIDKTYPLKEIVEANRHVDGGHKRGNVVVSIGSDDKMAKKTNGNSLKN